MSLSANSVDCYDFGILDHSNEEGGSSGQSQTNSARIYEFTSKNGILVSTVFCECLKYAMTFLRRFASSTHLDWPILAVFTKTSSTRRVLRLRFRNTLLCQCHSHLSQWLRPTYHCPGTDYATVCSLRSLPQSPGQEHCLPVLQLPDTCLSLNFSQGRSSQRFSKTLLSSSSTTQSRSKRSHLELKDDPSTEESEEGIAESGEGRGAEGALEMLVGPF
jgi:hypothetical protein